MSSLNHRDIAPPGTTLRFLASALDVLYIHARSGYPDEVVGILAGDRANGLVRRVAPLINEQADDPARRYRVSGLMVMKAEQRLNEIGLEVLGYYHSHPDHPAMYSDIDQALALPNMSYVIVSVREGNVADMLSWRLRDDRSTMDQEAIQILADNAER